METNSNDDNIWVMESKVGMCCKELCGLRPNHQLLNNQLQHLCMQLDVYPETESHDDSIEGPQKLSQGKTCLWLFRGNSRMKLYK